MVQAGRHQFETDLIAAMAGLRTFALSLSRDAQVADDLVQDTVLAALTHAEKFVVGTNFSAWLFTILRNKFYTRFRKKRREVEDPDEMLAKAVPFEDSPLVKLEVMQAFELVDMLPPEWGIPLRMLADGATYEEIASELQEHVGTIKSRINRARAQLIAAE